MTKLEVYRECFNGIDPRNITVAQVNAKYWEYSKRYHPDHYIGKPAQEIAYAEKMFKEYIPIIAEIRELVKKGILEEILRKESMEEAQKQQRQSGQNYRRDAGPQAFNQRSRSAGNSYGHEQGYRRDAGPQATSQRSKDTESRRQSAYEESQKAEYSFIDSVGDVITIKFVGELSSYDLNRYEVKIWDIKSNVQTTNYIYTDNTVQLNELESVGGKFESYVQNRLLNRLTIEEALKYNGGYIGGYDYKKDSWTINAEIAEKLNEHEINIHMQKKNNVFQRSDGSFIGLYDMGLVSFGNSKQMMRQYKYFDYKTGKIGIIKGDIDLITLRAVNEGRSDKFDYYKKCMDSLLSESRIQEKEDNLDGYVGTVGIKNNQYVKMNHSVEALNYFKLNARKRALVINSFKEYYSTEDLKRTQKDESARASKSAFDKMRDACKNFKEWFMGDE